MKSIRRSFPLDEYRSSLFYLVKWLGVAFVAGWTGTFTVYSFVKLIALLQTGWGQTGLPLPLLIITGTLLVTALLYKIAPDAAGEGIPAYIQTITHPGNRFPLKTTITKYFAALLTLGSYGNGGIVGPLGRVSAGIVSETVQRLFRGKERKADLRLAGICGMAACVGAIFHSALGAGFFAAEVIHRRNMTYKDLFPAILSSSFATFFCKSLHLSPFYRFTTEALVLGLQHLYLIIAVSFLAGFLGRGFNLFYGKLAGLMRRDHHEHRIIKGLAGTLLAFVPVWLINPHLLGTSNRFLIGIMGEHELLYGILPESWPLVLVCLIMILLKITANSLTVAAGMSAGFTGPMAIVGMLLGAGIADLAGIIPFTADYYALVAAGFTSVLASSINVPIAAAVLGIELFGLHYGFPTTFAAIIGFQINRWNNIYEELDISA